MKRMSEVFDLPVHIDGIIGIRSHGLNSTFEQDDHAAHAINHVDALADALLGLVAVVDENDLGKFGLIALNNAEKALKAYRGEK